MPDPDGIVRSFASVPRRHLTILFADVSQFTALAGSVEPERCLAVVQHLKRCSRQVITKHGGIVVDFRGDSVMAMFGFPEPSEQDGRRAIEAALELHVAIRQLPENCVDLPPLRLHTGVHCGPVLLIEDDPAPGQYVVIGEATSVAARLSDLAVDDEILVSGTTLGGDSHFFQVRDRGPLRLQGKTDPVRVMQVLGHSPASTRFEARIQGGLTPFVGRTAELDALRQMLDEVIAGGCRTVAIVAPGGTGKTRLVDRFLTEAAHRSVQIGRGYCENYLGAEPLQPFRQIVQRLTLRDHLAADALANVGIGTVCERLEAAARQGTLVLFVDDWQWADDASRQVLVALHRTRPPSTLVVIASRAPVSDASLGETIRVFDLAPLDSREVSAAILALSPHVDPLSAERIRTLSGGNPLFIEELCHWAAHGGATREVAAAVDRPAWLSTLIESRVSRLPPRQTALVRMAAVLGTVIPTSLLEPLTGCRADDPIWRELADRDLIYAGIEEGTLRFKQGITRDVIYGSIGLPERQRLHREVAQVLEQRAAEAAADTALEALSYHYRGADDPDRTAHYGELAGNKALAAGAPDRARSQFHAALSAVQALASNRDAYLRWSRIVSRFGLACVFDPSTEHFPLFVRAAELATAHGDSAGLARAEYWSGFIRYAMGDTGPALQHYERANHSCLLALDTAREAGATDAILEMESLRVQLQAAIGQALAAAGHHHQALDLLDQALNVKRRHRTGRPAVGSAYALACKGAVLGELGQFADAYACFDEALSAIRAGHPAVESSIGGWRSAVYLWQGCWSEARETAVRAEHLAAGIGSLYVLGMCQSVAAYATWMLEQSTEALGIVVRATSWLEARDKRLLISLNYGWLADLAASAMDEKTTRQCLARAITRARRRDPLGLAMCYRAMARIAAQDRPPRAERYFALAMGEALGRQSRREEAVTLLEQAQFEIVRGHEGVARDLLLRAQVDFARMHMAWHSAQAEKSLSQLQGSLSRL